MVNHEEALEREDRRIAFGLQGPMSEQISKKYAREVLNSWLKKALLSIIGIPASIWFTIQVLEKIYGWFRSI